MSSAAPELGGLSSIFQRAAADLRLPLEGSWVQVSEPLPRWDEALDTGLPLLLHLPELTAARLLDELQECGLPDGTPALLVEADGAVREIRAVAPETPLTESVVCLGWSHPQQGWRARRPLSGRTYLVTRARPQGEHFAHRLQELGARALVVPTITFREPDSEASWREAVRSIEGFDWVVFTSKNGVDFFLRKLLACGKDARSFQGRIAAIGPTTAEALQRFGLRADLMPEEYVAESLLQALLQTSPRRVLIPRAQEAREILPEQLGERGVEVLVAPVYRTVIPAGLPREALSAPSDSRLLFTASSTVKNWVAMTGHLGYPCHCIGPITAATAKDFGLRVLSSAEVFTEDGLLHSILEYDRTH